MTATFAGGPNIAMKVPPYQFAETVSFYKDILGLEEIDGATDDTVGFKFGANNLWIDKVSAMSQAELWLQVVTNDTTAASAALNNAGITRCDDIEALADDFDGFWISSPAAMIHLIERKTSDQ